jgi:hypothetical protein
VRRLPEQRRAEAQLREDLLLHRDDGLEKWQNLDEKWLRKSLKMMENDEHVGYIWLLYL